MAFAAAEMPTTPAAAAAEISLRLDFNKPNTAPTAAAATTQLAVDACESEVPTLSCDVAACATLACCGVFTAGLTKATGNAMAMAKQRDTIVVDRETILLVSAS
eukprot:2749233-Amphidinium_carterae.1